ncbi:MAG: anti-sigma factor [Rhodocyclaceae bacterium]
MKRSDPELSPLNDTLLRYVNDRLDVDDRDRAGERLRSDPDAQQRIAAWRAQNQVLHAHYDAVLHGAVPPHLLRAARRASHRSPLRHAAAIAWLVLGVGIGWVAHVQHDVEPEPATLPHIAALAHATYTAEKRHAVEVAAAEEAHLVTWLSRRLDRPLKVPQLGPMGYELMGGRMLPSETGPVAQFMFQNADGQRLTLHLRTQKGDVPDSSFQFAREGKVSVFYWLDDRVGYALSGDLERDKLLPIAREVWNQLSAAETNTEAK